MHLIIGTGKVGLPLSQLFHASNIPALSTSLEEVPSPLTGAASDVIQSIFMTPPPVADMLQAMKPFIDFAAKEKGVKRFILLSASLVPLGGPAHGSVHKYVSELGVEYAAIRPTWFFRTTFHPPPGFVFYADTYKRYQSYPLQAPPKSGSSTRRDIAEAAFRAMTDKEPLNGSYIVYGPELLTYADAKSPQVAKILSSVSCEYKEHAMRVMPAPAAEAMATLGEAVKGGAEERLFLNGPAGEKEKEEIWKGKRTFESYAEEIKDVWKN
ncbi:hypothetical protein BT96DRAFT_917630 [Gymnopus androsaceus JB14]|uniref:NAD(P)-binding domain-containing protein n=1 Tax=Gymnopus androsaceus JB14 TaxID=1447944 RepID=A0A6A4HYT5_9AGAR|nr:hypothetical protein BT96DRAFT_917630 [Gymnopus androsaceus JB14]